MGPTVSGLNRGLKIIPARLLHVGSLATNMRDADKLECRALGRSPKDALRMGLLTSLYSMTAVEDTGAPVAMFGLHVVSVLNGTARPWFLGTERVMDYPRELLVVGKKILSWWRDEFPTLTNIVAVENHKAVRLLMAWGAEVGGKQQMHNGVLFVPFRFPAIQAEPVAP